MRGWPAPGAASTGASSPRPEGRATISSSSRNRSATLTTPATDGGSIEADRVLLSVSDQGIGFDEKYLERIFQPFQRLHGREEYEGNGTALATCRKTLARLIGPTWASRWGWSIPTS